MVVNISNRFLKEFRLSLMWLSEGTTLPKVGPEHYQNGRLYILVLKLSLMWLKN